MVVLNMVLGSSTENLMGAIQFARNNNLYISFIKVHTGNHGASTYIFSLNQVEMFQDICARRMCYISRYSRIYKKPRVIWKTYFPVSKISNATVCAMCCTSVARLRHMVHLRSTCASGTAVAVRLVPFCCHARTVPFVPDLLSVPVGGCCRWMDVRQSSRVFLATGVRTPSARLRCGVEVYVASETTKRRHAEMTMETIPLVYIQD